MANDAAMGKMGNFFITGLRMVRPRLERSPRRPTDSGNSGWASYGELQKAHSEGIRNVT